MSHFQWPVACTGTGRVPWGSQKSQSQVAADLPEHFWVIHLQFGPEALTWTDPVTVCRSKKVISGGATTRSNHPSIPCWQQSRGTAWHGKEERSHPVSQTPFWGNLASWQVFHNLRSIPLHKCHREPVSSPALPAINNTLLLQHCEPWKKAKQY